MSKKILIACGGTGGHINPGIAIAELIRSRLEDAQILFVGTPDGMEARLVREQGYKMRSIRSAGFQRKLTLNNIKRNAKALNYLMSSDYRAKKIIRDFEPDLCIGTGGYVSGPILAKAEQMGIHTLIHEQNAFPGVTNKLLARKADVVMLTFEEARKYMSDPKKCVVTGLPVRKGIVAQDRAEAKKKLGFEKGMTILSFGGSLGAGCINTLMESIIENTVKKGLEVNHIHGYGGMGRETFPKAMKEKGIPLTGKNLRISEYINDMDVCMAAADLVICRSGASTLAELEAAGRPSVLIPSPVVTGNHQYHNAKVLSDHGAAFTIEQKDVTVEKIQSIIDELLAKPEKLLEMSEKAAALAITDTNERIWKCIEKYL